MITVSDALFRPTSPSVSSAQWARRGASLQVGGPQASSCVSARGTGAGHGEPESWARRMPASQPQGLASPARSSGEDDLPLQGDQGVLGLDAQRPPECAICQEPRSSAVGRADARKPGLRGQPGSMELSSVLAPPPPVLTSVGSSVHRAPVLYIRTIRIMPVTLPPCSCGPARSVCPQGLPT